MPKIRVLQLMQKNLNTIGIVRDLVDQPYPLNVKILLGFLTVISSFFCNLMFTVREAKTFAEYTESVYMSSLAALIILALIIYLFNIAKLYSLRDGFEYLANTSE